MRLFIYFIFIFSILATCGDHLYGNEKGDTQGVLIINPYKKNSKVTLSSYVDRWHPLPSHYEPDDLVTVPLKYRAPASRGREMKLRREALYWFVKMIEDAAKNGVEIKIISAYRSYLYQEFLYKRAIKNYGLNQMWVAKPGYSEHQLGTTCDLGTLENGYRLTVDFEDTDSFQWLLRNSYRYGIYLSYPKYSAKLKGYNYEPWHFRYWGKNRFNNSKYVIFFTR